MKIVYIAFEFPYPANHGGRKDTWNRIMALNKRGVEVHLVTWKKAEDKILARDIDVVSSHVISLRILSVKGFLYRLLRIVRFPYLVSSRKVSKSEYTNLLKELEIIKPDNVFIDGIYGADLGFRIANDLKCITGVRLHNLEYEYMLGQFKLSKSLKNKARIGLSLIHLQKYEKEIVKKSDVFFDISMFDLNRRKEMGFSNGFWLPPIHFVSSTQRNLDVLDNNYHLCFLGNLSTPNNLDGLIWFMYDVLPLLRVHIEDIKVLIMGSIPSPKFVELCKEMDNVYLIENPICPDKFIERSQILFNPVRFGSGVNIKAIDMLFTDKPVITTSAGVKGLPKDIKEVFSVINSPEEFEKSMLDLIGHSIDKNVIAKRETLRKFFKESAIEDLIDKLNRQQSIMRG